MRSIGPAVTREQSPAFLRNSNGRLDLPGPTQEAIAKCVFLLAFNVSKMEKLKTYQERPFKYIFNKSVPQKALPKCSAGEQCNP